MNTTRRGFFSVLGGGLLAAFVWRTTDPLEMVTPAVQYTGHATTDDVTPYKSLFDFDAVAVICGECGSRHALYRAMPRCPSCSGAFKFTHFKFRERA